MTTHPTHGGPRPNSGRKKGSNAYGETTKAIRVPESLIPSIQALLSQRKQQFEQFSQQHNSVFLPKPQPTVIPLPLYIGKVAAGFPSPADDYIEKNLDLNELLVQKPAATFFVKAQGESMLGAGIHPNDILVVDRSIEPADGKVVIAALNGELTVKRLSKTAEGIWYLKAENPQFPDILLNDGLELVIWGVVTNVIHNL
jgi:DNA polymerase V